MIHAIGLFAGVIGMALIGGAAYAADNILFAGGALLAILWLLALALTAITRGGGGD